MLLQVMPENMSNLISAGGFEYGVKHFYSPQKAALTEILFSALQLSHESAIELINLGSVYVNHQRQTQNNEIEQGLLCRVHTKPRRYNCQKDWRDLVVFECSDFVILNKPSGIPSHPSVDNAIENSLTQLSLALSTPLLITHRLDTLTAGLIVYAKNSNFVKMFNTQIQNKLVEKKYVALVETQADLPKNVTHYMEPSPRAPKKVSPTFHENWAMCELEIIKQTKLKHLSWVKINLLTGRTHQIRSQMSELNAPICGDSLYGSTLSFKDNAIALRACELQFNWGSQRMLFNLPEDFDI